MRSSMFGTGGQNSRRGEQRRISIVSLRAAIDRIASELVILLHAWTVIRSRGWILYRVTTRRVRGALVHATEAVSTDCDVKRPHSHAIWWAQNGAQPGISRVAQTRMVRVAPARPDGTRSAAGCSPLHRQRQSRRKRAWSGWRRSRCLPGRHSSGRRSARPAPRPGSGRQVARWRECRWRCRRVRAVRWRGYCGCGAIGRSRSRCRRLHAPSDARHRCVRLLGGHQHQSQAQCDQTDPAENAGRISRGAPTSKGRPRPRASPAAVAAAGAVSRGPSVHATPSSPYPLVASRSPDLKEATTLLKALGA